MISRALVLMVFPSLVLAAASPSPSASPAAAPDPMEPFVNAYQQNIRKDLGRAYTSYEAVTQPRPELPPLARPEESLERLSDIEFLGALPTAWVKTLNAKGDAAQQQGQADGVDKPAPDEYKQWEGSYSALEPSGRGVREPDQWAGGVAGEPDQYRPAFTELEKQQKKGQSIDQAKYATAAKQIEAEMASKVKAAASRALKQLKSALNPPLAKVMATADPSTPWTSLKSALFDTAAKQYLAERYSKGRWAAGAKGPKNTMGTEETEASKQKSSIGGGEKNSEGSTGDGTVVKPPSGEGTGTGTGSGSAAPGEPPPGGGTGTGNGGPATGGGAGGGTGTGTGTGN